MRRREFITLLGGAAAWPLAASAQQPAKVPRIGFLGAQSAYSYASQLEGFRLGLRDHGYVEGTTIVIEYRWAEGKYERLRELVTELIRSNVDVIVTHGTPGALAAKQATTAIPIVVTLLGDPVASGIVVSLARPEANITGQSFFSPELMANATKESNCLTNLTALALMFLCMMDRREALLLVDRLKRRTRDPEVLTLCEYVHGTDVHGTIPGFRRPGDGTPPAVFPSTSCPLCAARRAAETARKKKWRHRRRA